jgi:simple sugar transport system ATP-binding protein
MGFVPEERLGRGAVPRMSLADNALLTAHRRGMLKHGLIDFKAVEEFSRECIAKYNVKCGGPSAQAKSLSGGNLQKYIMGREILQQPKLLVVAQPTWGRGCRRRGVHSAGSYRSAHRGHRDSRHLEELDELFEICDRIAVIAKGRLSPTKRTADTNVEEIGVWMSGMWPGADSATGERRVA